MEKFNFIRTSDPGTKTLLIKEGFQLVSDDGKYATFVNDCNKKLTFDDKKIQYTNMLCV